VRVMVFFRRGATFFHQGAIVFSSLRGEGAAGSFFSANLLINFRQWIFLFFRQHVLKKNLPGAGNYFARKSASSTSAAQRDKISFSPLAQTMRWICSWAFHTLQRQG
jgi:hypothetical protein